MQKELYRKFSPRMYAICLRYAKNTDDGQDILQEGFVKVFTKISQFSGEHSFEGWMKRIFVNTAITHYHSNLKYQYKEEINDTLAADNSLYHVDDGEYSKEELLGVINGLSEGYRVVFNMFAIEGFKHKEIAQMLGIDESTSKSQFHRARKIIQQRLQTLSNYKITQE